MNDINNLEDNNVENNLSSPHNRIAHQLTETLTTSQNHMSTQLEKTAPTITLDDVKSHLEGNINSLTTETLSNHDMMAGSVVCGDGRTVGANVPKDNDNIPNVQIFGGYSGLNLGMLAGVKKGFGSELSDDEIIAINTQFTKNMKGIYEHTDDHDHEDGKCGCGHLNNLRANAAQFGLSPALIAHHSELMRVQGIDPDKLIDDHKEKGVIIIANSKKKTDDGKGETISTVFSNKLGNDDQFFVLNADAIGIMLTSAADKYAEIIHILYPEKNILKEALLDAFERAIGEQTISTAVKLASHLAEKNTFIFDGEHVTPVNLIEFAGQNLKSFGPIVSL